MAQQRTYLWVILFSLAFVTITLSWEILISWYAREILQLDYQLLLKENSQLQRELNETHFLIEAEKLKSSFSVSPEEELNIEKIWNKYQIYHKSARNSECSKYIVYRPSEAGFGNRIQVLVAAFQLALLTGRIFVIDWKEPCDMRELFETPSINWNFDEIEGRDLWWNKNSTWTIKFRNNDEFITDLFSKKNLTTELEGFKYVVIQHFSSFEPLMRRNPLYENILFQLFGDNSIKVVAHLLFSPSKIIQKEIEQFKVQHHLIGTEVIAMQIRRGTKETSFVPIATLEQEEMFFKCAKLLSSSEKVIHY
jgi:hypothetical protein